jgi:hypothetical protein
MFLWLIGRLSIVPLDGVSFFRMIIGIGVRFYLSLKLISAVLALNVTHYHLEKVMA